MPPVIELFIFADSANISIWRSSIYSGDGQKLILYLCGVLTPAAIDPFKECTLTGKQVCDLIRYCHDEFKTALPQDIDTMVSSENNYKLLIDDW